MPVWIQAVGGLILIASFYLFYLVVRENPYLSSAVRIQRERGQVVVSTGLYRYVRHPMYAAYIPFIYFGNSSLVGFLVWSACSSDIRWFTGNTSIEGRTFASGETRRLRYLYGKSEISIHPICLVERLSNWD